MIKVRLVANIVIVALGMMSCQFGARDKSEKELVLTVQAKKEFQTIHNFGASDAWSCQFVGANWPIEKKEQIADWLFSTDLDENGNPVGIGLSTWRFNIGGGSAQQGDNSKIRDEWRRAESFMVAKNEFDWSKQNGQRWFLKAAKERGVDEFVGFVNSPPVFLTKNNKAFSSSKTNYNLPQENYQAYAEYLSHVVKNLHQIDGVELDYVSPFNEPQWDWIDGGQEGTPAQNEEIYDVTKLINEEFSKNKLQTLIEIPETAQLNYVYEEGNRPGRASQLNTFFDPQSSYFVGNLSHVAKKIAGHSYFTTWPLDKMVDTRKKIASSISDYKGNVEFWMSEYCLFEHNNEIDGVGRDLGMKSALYLARVIFSDLVFANASSWQWWIAVTPYNYKDGLIYIDHNKFDGEINDSKMLWAMGNYSRFIRPGMKRVNITRSDKLKNEDTLDALMASAYISEDGQKVSVVLVNYENEPASIKVLMEDFKGIGELNVYVTDEDSENNLKLTRCIKEGDALQIPARSIVTISNID